MKKSSQTLIRPQSKEKKKIDEYSKFVTLCEYYNVSLPSEFFTKLKNFIFCLNYETLNYEQTSAVSEGLHFLSKLTALEIQGRYKNQKSLQKPSNFSEKIQKPVETIEKIQPKKARPESKKIRSKNEKSHGFYHVSKLIQGVNYNISFNKVLKNLTVAGLKLTAKAWKLLGEGLESSNSIENLNINYCFLKDCDLVYLQRGFFSENLRNLNFSNNLLEEECGVIIGTAISKQNSIKDSKTWKNNLRSSENTQNEKGLNRIDLSFNNLNDKAILKLAPSLHYDSFVKVIHLNNNKFTTQVYLELFNLLQVNSTILFIDFSYNEIPQDLQIFYDIIEKLCFNLQELKEKLWNSKDIEWEININLLLEYVDKLGRNSDAVSKKLIDKESGFKQKKYLTIKKGLESSNKHPELQRIKSQKNLKPCQNCQKFERELFQSKSQCVELKLQNNELERKLKKLNKN